MFNKIFDLVNIDKYKQSIKPVISAHLKKIL